MNRSTAILPFLLKLQGAARVTRIHLVVLFLFLLPRAMILFPLTLQPADHLPDWGDPVEHAWVLAWDAHQLVNDPAALYNANIFLPHSNSLAFSESQVASALLGMPLFLVSGNAILAGFVFGF